MTSKLVLGKRPTGAPPLPQLTSSMSFSHGMSSSSSVAFASASNSTHGGVPSGVTRSSSAIANSWTSKTSSHGPVPLSEHNSSAANVMEHHDSNTVDKRKSINYNGVVGSSSSSSTLTTSSMSNLASKRSDDHKLVEANTQLRKRAEAMGTQLLQEQANHQATKNRLEASLQEAHARIASLEEELARAKELYASAQKEAAAQFDALCASAAAEISSLKESNEALEKNAVEGIAVAKTETYLMRVKLESAGVDAVTLARMSPLSVTHEGALRLARDNDVIISTVMANVKQAKASVAEMIREIEFEEEQEQEKQKEVEKEEEKTQVIVAVAPASVPSVPAAATGAMILDKKNEMEHVNEEVGAVNLAAQFESDATEQEQEQDEYERGDEAEVTQVLSYGTTPQRRQAPVFSASSSSSLSSLSPFSKPAFPAARGQEEAAGEVDEEGEEDDVVTSDSVARFMALEAAAEEEARTEALTQQHLQSIMGMSSTDEDAAADADADVDVGEVMGESSVHPSNKADYGRAEAVELADEHNVTAIGADNHDYVCGGNVDEDENENDADEVAESLTTNCTRALLTGLDEGSTAHMEAVLRVEEVRLKKMQALLNNK